MNTARASATMKERRLPTAASSLCSRAPSHLRQQCSVLDHGQPWPASSAALLLRRLLPHSARSTAASFSALSRCAPCSSRCCWALGGTTCADGTFLTWQAANELDWHGWVLIG